MALGWLANKKKHFARRYTHEISVSFDVGKDLTMSTHIAPSALPTNMNLLFSKNK